MQYPWWPEQVVWLSLLLFFYPMELIAWCVAIFKLHFYNTATTSPFYLTYVGEHSF